jgi:Ig-like domain from next to BRCA1 gene
MNFRSRRASLCALIVCLGTLLLNNNCLAQFNATLLSVSVTNGTTVAPRSIFTQTWTFQNTGTTTWTNGANGCTLDLTNLDSLGAVCLITNTAGGTYHFPRAVINSGKNVAAGGQASYSMEFIAPEASGSYTDYFALNGTNWFGPIVTVQVTVAPGGNTNVFDRCRAISYANNYAAYVASDGYFWTNTDYPDFGFYGTGVFTPVPVGGGLDGGVGDDCAHFVSCCIGNEPHLRGAGINIPSRTTPTYGEPSAGDIIYNILLPCGYAVQVSSLSQMEPGDVIGWNWEGETNNSGGYIDHVTLYMGNGVVACHAASILDVNPKFFGTGPVTVPGTGWSWHLIHILDYPSLWTKLSGKSMAFTWTTNWNGYSLYSASSIGGTWTKITTKPTVTGDTNKLSITMPSSGSIYYRLQMP